MWGFRAGDAGGVTVEAALAIASLVTVLVLCLGAVLSIAYQVRCHDAAREAARLAARGDRTRAVEVAARVAPPDAGITLREEGDLIVAVVTAESPLFPLVTLTAEAVSVREPEGLR
ncbi:TadE family type IV pilus minor pilin [Rhodococcus sp. (in: high G+C Gram-positive bacteria)]|uniref:TadE family type IV pilus minor pilin n=1 Tax=Rhodococcus sp. TaxID=1831 RepID=UPI0019E25CC0|nr:TadE family type IV pilus minor pilin [Rhodococcus sp. (in: high G+C Gram-positive bacteria)]MBF0661198.1 pilus assembly protein TadE [Rhodococcus sp. (in: high G+C Gram-positive bacteria)]